MAGIVTVLLLCIKALDYTTTTTPVIKSCFPRRMSIVVQLSIMAEFPVLCTRSLTDRTLWANSLPSLVES